jgi:hypothetical protein
LRFPAGAKTAIAAWGIGGVVDARNNIWQDSRDLRFTKFEPQSLTVISILKSMKSKTKSKNPKIH